MKLKKYIILLSAIALSVMASAFSSGFVPSYSDDDNPRAAKKRSNDDIPASAKKRMLNSLNINKADSTILDSIQTINYLDSTTRAQLLDSLSLALDSLKPKQLTVDSVLSSVSTDSILAMIKNNQIIEVLPDTTTKKEVKPDTVAKSKSALDAPVDFEASDSVTFDYIVKRANFYGEGKVNYQNLELTADEISMSLDSSIVHANGRIDTTKNEIIGKPVFKQGNDEYEPDSISYNFKTQKAFIANVFTDQGEGIMMSSESKRDSLGVMYVQHAKYTTCDAAHPHFYLHLTRAKVRPGEDVVFGPAYLVVEDVPLPLAIPYGFFPFTKSYSSGFIMPTYGDESSRGFYLRDGGYYFAISDKVDLKALGEIYTKGSWGISLASTYKWRYHFSGNFMFSYQNTKEGEKNMPDYSVAKSFKISWTHRQDSKSNPTQTFSASVNFATSSYERNNLLSRYNPESYTQSQRTSSINYSKTLSRIGLNISTGMNLAQNMRDSSLSVSFPNLTLSLQRFYPFKRKKMAGKERWYEKISLSYTGNLGNSLTAKESEFFKKSLIKDWKNGMRHQVPINATFTFFNYLNITPSFNFTDRMYTNKIKQSWDGDKHTAVRDTTYGFYNVYNYNMSISASTKLYGMYTPMPWFGGKKIAKIRHVFTPSLSFSYAPDFGKSRYGFYDTYVKTETDSEGNTRVSTVSYSPFSHGIYGTAPKGKTGSVRIDVSNNIEMKVRTEKDSTGYKKISLIDELGGDLAYNMAAKSHPWSDLNMRVRLKLTKNYTFSMNAQFATYAYEFNDQGNVVVGNKTEWSHGRFGRFQGMSQNLSYTFNNQTFSKIKSLFTGKGKTTKESDDDDDDYDDEETETDPLNQNVDPARAKARNATSKSKTEVTEDGYLSFTMPWSFSVSYGVNMREDINKDRFKAKRMRYPYKLTHTMNFSGNLRIAEGWNINFSSGWDFNYKRISMTTASLSRDLHCFSMSASMVIAPYRSYNFTFACNASTLADALRWKKQSNYGNRLEWY